MEQGIVSKLGKKYVKAVYCHSVYLAYMQSTSWKIPGWMKHKPESRFSGRNTNNLRYVDDTILIAKSGEELIASWWRWKRTVKKLA